DYVPVGYTIQSLQTIKSSWSKITRGNAVSRPLSEIWSIIWQKLRTLPCLLSVGSLEPTQRAQLESRAPSWWLLECFESCFRTRLAHAPSFNKNPSAA